MFRLDRILPRSIFSALWLAFSLGCSRSAPSPDLPDPSPKQLVNGDGSGPSPISPELAPADLSTDDGVRDAFEKATGEALHEIGCIGRTGVEDVIVVGSFAHDRGCDVGGAFVGGKFVDEKRLAREGLPLAGWEAMGADERPAFALQWAEKVLFHWGGDFVSTSVKAFEFEDTPAFVAPVATAHGDEVVVTAWIEEPSGMQDQDSFNLVELRFSAGGVVSRTVKDGFAVDGARLR